MTTEDKFASLYLAPQATYALVVTHTSEGRYWRLEFQTSPIAEVTLEGNTPTREEIVAALGNSWLPTVMIGVVEAVVGNLVRDR